MNININIYKNMNTYVCNICSESIEENKIVRLKCNPTKHIFCYDCIYDWYKFLKKPLSFGNYTIKTMCPICRKNGGLLLLPDGKHFEQGIHVNNLSDTDIDTDTSIKECGYKLKSSNNTCIVIGNTLYDGLCKTHFKIKIKENNATNNTKISPTSSTSTINTNTKTSSINLCVIINPNKKDNECGAKLKSKNDYCKSSSKTIYGGFCGIHKSYANNIPIQPNVKTTTKKTIII